MDCECTPEYFCEIHQNGKHSPATPTPKGEKSDAREYAKFYVGDCDHLPRGACKRCVERAIKDAFRDGENSMRERAIKEIPSFRRDDFLIGPNVIVGKHTNLEIVFKALKKYIGALPSAQKEEGRE